MRSPTRVRIDDREAEAGKADAASALERLGAALRPLIEKLERNWPLSVAVVLVALVVAARI